MEMKVGKFKKLCLKYPEMVVSYKPYDCGSWRGSYDEPCIFVENEEAALEEYLPYLDRLTSGEEFFGYKGGEYVYNEHDNINIELDSSNYTGDESLLRDLFLSFIDKL